MFARDDIRDDEPRVSHIHIIRLQAPAHADVMGPAVIQVDVLLRIGIKTQGNADFLYAAESHGIRHPAFYPGPLNGGIQESRVLIQIHIEIKQSPFLGHPFLLSAGGGLGP